MQNGQKCGIALPDYISESDCSVVLEAGDTHFEVLVRELDQPVVAVCHAAVLNTGEFLAEANG